MDRMSETGSPELRKLSEELRRLELQQRRLELERARDLDEVERQHRRQELRALTLDNDAKGRDLDWKRSGLFWTRTGLLVAWVAALVPVTLSVNEYWDEREETAKEERRLAAAERKAALQEAMRRYADGVTPAAFELVLYPGGVSFLVGQLQWDAGGPNTEDEIEKARAALIALESASVELTEDQKELLREERGQLLDRLEEIAGRWEAGRDEVGEQEAFLALYEIHRRLRRLLGDEDDGWTEQVASDGDARPTTRGAEVENTFRRIEETLRE